MKKWMSKFLNRLSDAIFPNDITCVVCGEELSYDTKYHICDNCIDQFDFLVGKTCAKCGARVTADTIYCSDCQYVKHVVDRNYGALVYTGKVKQMIHALKYDGKKYLAVSLGKMLNDLYCDVARDYQPDIVIPIPLNSVRLRTRGYNQTELILNEVEGIGDKIATDVVVRIKDTPHQASLPKKDRRSNVKGAFEVTRPECIKDKNILIVDDIFTTGATIDECADVLYKAGAKLVRSMTLCNSHQDNALDDSE